MRILGGSMLSGCQSLFRRRPNDVVASYAKCLAERDAENAALRAEVSGLMETLAKADFAGTYQRDRISYLEGALAASHDECRSLERDLMLARGQEASAKWAA